MPFCFFICMKIQSISILILYLRYNYNYNYNQKQKQRLIQKILTKMQKRSHRQNPHKIQKRNQNIIDRNQSPHRNITTTAHSVQNTTLSRIPARSGYHNFHTLGNEQQYLQTINQNQTRYDNHDGQRGSASVDKQLGLCRRQLECVIKQNRVLAEAHKGLEIENLKLRQRNKILQNNLAALLNEISQIKIHKKFDEQQTKLFPTNQYTNTKQHTLMETQKSGYPRPRQKRIKMLTENSECYPKYQILIKNLQEQNQLLTQYKNSCLTKISRLQQTIQFIQPMLDKQRQQNIYKSDKLKQLRQLHKEDISNVKKMQMLMFQTNNQLNKILKDAQYKEQEAGIVHDKFHKEMAKMKTKCERYKQKMEEYRAQRDMLAIQIQKAKIQIGTFTLRKYFPEDSDD